MLYHIYSGVVDRGFQFASGEAVNRKTNPSPFSDGTLKLQDRHFRSRGFDMAREVPDLFWGTINIKIGHKLKLGTPDTTLSSVDWTGDEKEPTARIAPESFSFIRCCVAYRGSYHTGHIYYPHPETKPATNEHRFDVIEVLTRHIDGLRYGADVSVLCRADAFMPA